MNIRAKVKRRLNWYWDRFRVNNPVVGRAVELAGNKVRMDGLVFSVDCPQVSTGHKSTLAFQFHEMEERELAKRWVPSDIPIVELGGGLGVVSCLANRKLNDPSQHVVVEANPEMVPVLTRNRDLNRCRFVIINRALGYDADTIRFAVDGEFVASSTVETNAPAKLINVPTISVETVMAEHCLDEAGIIADIEGGEVDLIRRELPRLGERIRYVLAEMHPLIVGEEIVAALKQELVEMGFEHAQTIGDSSFFARPARP